MAIIVGLGVLTLIFIGLYFILKLPGGQELVGMFLGGLFIIFGLALSLIVVLVLAENIGNSILGDKTHVDSR
jgi:RsiW-degrading membrane proteinase PrsW (M82 family)